MDASSISEEDIIELCVKQGCTHPLGVLHYSAAESVVLFLTMDDLKCVTNDIAGDTKLHDEAITVKTIAPTEAHMSVYATVWHAKPSKGGGRPHTPPQQTPTGGETPHCLHAELSDLDNHKLHQLMTDLNQEFVQCGLVAPPVIPLQMTGYAHQAVKSPRRMTQRSPFWEGKMGSAKAAHSRTTNWRRSSLWITSETTLSCTSRTRYGVINYHPNIGSVLRHP